MTPPATPAPRPETAPASSGGDYRIAFVEDSAEDFAAYQRVFRRCGTLIHWSTAEKALEALRGGEVDLADLDAVLVDLHLPGIDGVEFVRAARALPQGEAPTVCMLTSSSSTVDIDRATDAGANAYFVKPEGSAGLRLLPGRLAEVAAAR